MLLKMAVRKSTIDFLSKWEEEKKKKQKIYIFLKINK